MTRNDGWSGVPVLVTGGAGFIGSHLVDSLISSGAKVWVIDNLDTGESTNLSNHDLIPWNGVDTVSNKDEIIFVHGSIEDNDMLQEVIPQVDFIFHLAAIASVARCESNPIEADSVNLAATLEIYSQASNDGLKGMCFSSSAALYGNTTIMPIDESTPVAPISKYGESKALAEESLISPSNDLPAASLRLFNVYGPRQNPNSANAGVISILIDRIKSGSELMLNGDGEQSRDFVYVQDVCNAFMMVGAELLRGNGASDCNNQAFNVCTGVSNSIIHSVKLIEALVDITANITHGPEREGDIRESLGSSEKLRKMVGWRPQTEFERGLELTSEWQM